MGADLDIDAASLGEQLKVWARRLGFRRGLRRAGRAILAAALIVGAFAAIAAWIPVPSGPLGSPRAIAAVLAALGSLVAFGVLWTARFSRVDAAHVADMILGSQALFVTAEGALKRLAQGEALTEPERACLSRAASVAARTPAGQIAPMRFGLRWAAALLPAAMAAAVIWAPYAVDARRGLDQARLDAALKTLESHQKSTRTPTGEVSDAAIERGMQRLIQRLKQGELTPREATEALGELKQQLRAEALARAERVSQASRAAQSAARALNRAEGTSALARAMADGARSQRDQDREEAAARAAEEVRKLAELNREQRQEAAGKLDEAARAARAAGDQPMSEALQKAADAARSGDPEALQQAADQLQQAMNQASQGQGDLDQLAQALDQAQQALSEGQQRAQSAAPGQQPGQGDGDENRIAPGPRDWKAGPKGGGEGEGKQQAGQGHSDEETEGKAIEGGHQDAERFGDERPEAKDVDYQELYEAFLLNSGDRIGTRVKGERGEGGPVDTLRGGQQSPRAEQARRALAELPVQYAREVDEAIGEETIPPVHRDAVRDYFDR